jgi:hypothetical protein
MRPAVPAVDYMAADPFLSSFKAPLKGFKPRLLARLFYIAGNYAFYDFNLSFLKIKNLTLTSLRGADLYLKVRGIKY